MMNGIFQLFLGHLIGDYVLQTNFIAKYKNQKISVLMIHILIIFLSTSLIILPKTLKSFLALILLSVIHFFIDIIKFKMNKNHFFQTTFYYILDQLMHFSSLIIISYFIENNGFLLDNRISLILSLAVFNSFFIGILSSFVYGSIKTYKRDITGYILRGCIPLISFPGPVYLIISLPVFSVINYFFNKKEQNEKFFSLYLSYLFSFIFIIMMEVSL